MNLNVIYIGIPLILIAIAAIVAAITFTVKSVKGRSRRSSNPKKSKKKQSFCKLFKAFLAYYKGKDVKVIKPVYIRPLESSLKPTDKLPKNTYLFKGFITDDAGEILLALSISGETENYPVRLSKNLEFISKSKDEDDDDEDEDDDD